MLVRLLTRSVWGAIFLAALLLLPAGDWRWPPAWAYLILFSTYGFATAIWLLNNDPNLFDARMSSPLSGDQRPRDRLIVIALLILFCLWYVFIAFDARRYGWSHVQHGRSS